MGCTGVKTDEIVLNLLLDTILLVFSHDIGAKTIIVNGNYALIMQLIWR
jgi:hypothetical protein